MEFFLLVEIRCGEYSGRKWRRCITASLGPVRSSGHISGLNHRPNVIQFCQASEEDVSEFLVVAYHDELTTPVCVQCEASPKSTNPPV